MADEFSTEFEKHCLPHLNLLKRYLFHKISNHSDAEDLLQDVLLAAYKGFGKLKDKDICKSWLIGIASNKCVDYYKAKAKKLEIPLDAINTYVVDERGVETTMLINDTLNLLADKDKQVLYLFYIRGYNQKDIALKLEIPLGTVKSRISKAKENFRALWPHASKKRGDGYMNKTRMYYELWLGKEGCLSSNQAIQFIYTKERNVVQAGYSARVDLYVWIEPDRIVVSYGDVASSKIDLLKERLFANQTIPEIRTLLMDVYAHDVNHIIKYEFDKLPEESSQQVKILSATDYQDYEQFFCECNPDASDISWLAEYFEALTSEDLCVAIYEDGKIVCCTDAPTMPYMANEVQEVGIIALPNYRRKGYATAVSRGAIANILRNKKTPFWSTASDNLGSQKLAARVGYKKLADVLTITF